MTTAPIPPNNPKQADEPKKEEAIVQETIAVESLEGKTSIDDRMTFEVVALAHQAAGDAANEIARRVAAAVQGSMSDDREQPAPVIVYLNDELAAALDTRRAFLAQADLLQQSYKEAQMIGQAGLDYLQSSPTVTARSFAATASAAVAVGSELIGLLRQDTSYYGRAVEVRNHVLGAELGRAIHEIGGMGLLWPGLSPSHHSLETRSKPASFLDGLRRAARARHAATRIVLELGAKAQDLDPKDSRLSQVRRILDHAHVLLDSAEAINEDLSQALYSPDERGNTPAHWLQLAFDTVDDLASLAKASVPVYLLRCWVESGGGSYRTKRNLLRSIFTSDGLSYSGGVVVCYALTDTEGQLLASGSAIERTSYVNFDNPRRGLVWWMRQRRGELFA